MEQNLINYNIDLQSNMLTKRLFLVKKNIIYPYINEYPLKDINMLIKENYLFKKNNLYVCKLKFNSEKDKKNNYNNNHHDYIFYIDSNENLYNNYINFRNMYKNLSDEVIGNKGYLYLEKIINNPLHNINDIYFFMMFAYMRIKDNNLELYIYNHDYYIVVNYSLDKYTINYINGYYGFFTKENLKKIEDQCKNIIISIIDIYGQYVENDNKSIDIWKFIFSIDKNYNIKLYNYDRFDKNINIFLNIKEDKNQYLYNDLLTNINNAFINSQDINFIFLKKYNLL